MVDVAEVEVIYATFHVDVGETPFFVALDYTKKKVSRVSSLIRMHRTNSFAQEASKKKRETKRRLDIEQRLESKACYDVKEKASSRYIRSDDTISMKIAILKERLKAKLEFCPVNCKINEVRLARFMNFSTAIKLRRSEIREMLLRK